MSWESGKMRKALVVDDSAFMRLSMKTILERNGYEVVGEAENGRIGVFRYKELQPDFVTMDVTMPEMDGLEALQEIKKTDPEAVVVMVTAMGQEAMVREAIMSGAKGFVVKPIVEEVLINAVKKLK